MNEDIPSFIDSIIQGTADIDKAPPLLYYKGGKCTFGTEFWKTEYPKLNIKGAIREFSKIKSKSPLRLSKIKNNSNINEI